MLAAHEHFEQGDVWGIAQAVLSAARLDGIDAPNPRHVVRCLGFRLEPTQVSVMPCGWFDLRDGVFRYRARGCELEENGTLMHELGHCGVELFAGTPTWVQSERIAWQVGYAIAMPPKLFRSLLERHATDYGHGVTSLEEIVFAHYPHVPRSIVCDHASLWLGGTSVVDWRKSDG